MPTRLNTPYADKDAVKAAGGRWDPIEKAWFAPDGADLAKFAKWLPAPTKSAPVAKPATAPATAAKPASPPAAPAPASTALVAGGSRGVALSALLTQIGAVVQRAFAEAVWVRAEIAELNVRQGHTYLALVERDAEGKLLAKSPATVWAGRRGVIEKFCRETGQDVAPGIKVLLAVTPKLSPNYGLSLDVTDIDPAYTLGDMVAKLKRIRDALARDGLLDRNKRYPMPADFTSVAVISPDGAAGLGDFKREADLLQGLGLCAFRYYAATFQGDAAPGSVGKALRTAAEDHKAAPFDAFAIIRGGGAVADLHWLNDEGLARLVATAPVPVFTGIGHEKDNTVLDEISHTRFDTPSKVVAHILATITHLARDGDTDMQAIQARAAKRLLRAETDAAALRRHVTEKAHHAIVLAGTQAKNLRERITAGAQRSVSLAAGIAAQAVADVATGAAWRPRRALEAADLALTHIRWGAEVAIGRDSDIAHQCLTDVRRGAGWRPVRAREAVDRLMSDTRREAEVVLANDAALARQHLVDVRRGAGWRPVRALEAAERFASDIRRETVGHLDAAKVSAAGMIEAVISRGPKKTLARGYAVVRDGNGKVLSSADMASRAEGIEIEFKDGRVPARRVS